MDEKDDFISKYLRIAIFLFDTFQFVIILISKE